MKAARSPAHRAAEAGRGGTVLHVSPRGSDRWSGRLAAPAAGGRDGPLATVEAARNLIRRLRRRGSLKQPVKVLLRGGVYELDRTLEFRPEDSGTAAHPVVYAAYPGEAPVLSGGRRIANWQPGRANGRACWVAELPDARDGRWNFTQLFVNGERRCRPRLPGTGYHRFTGVPADSGDGTGWDNGPGAASFRPGDIGPWKNPDDVKLMVLRLWFEMHHRIRNLDVEKGIVRFRARSFGTLRDETGEYSRYFAENVFEALKSPGQWYLDRPEGKLYYLPLPGETPETAAAVAPRLEVLVRFSGTNARPVSHIRLENLSLRHAEWDYPPDDAGSVQAGFKVPGAVVFDRAEHCVLYGGEVAHVAQYGVDIRTGSHGNQVVGCSLHDLGAGGVRIGHEWMNRTNETSTVPIRPRADAKPMAATVADCTIRDAGRIHLSAIGIWVGNSGCCRLVHNHIYNLNYTGISCGWTWGYEPTATRGNRIEFNHIHHINWDRVLSDNGGIYTLGPQPGTTIRGNLIHHVACFGYGGWGIYPDEGSSEMVIENNVVHHTRFAGFMTHYGRDNVVRNNVFALAEHDQIWPGKIERHRSVIFERNLVYWRAGSLKPSDWPPGNYTFRDNLFWNASGAVDFGDGRSLAGWQALDQHAGTVTADPLFADAEAGDFSLRPDSPALALGFKPIDLSAVGPRLRGRRPGSFADLRRPADPPRPIVRTVLERADGDRIRLTVENVGDAPAAGRVRLRAGTAAVFGGKPVLVFRGLKPGARQSAEWALRVDEGAERVLVESAPSGEGLVPALLLLEPGVEALLRQPPPRVKIPCLAGDEAGRAPVAMDWSRAAVLAPWRCLDGRRTDRRLEARLLHDGAHLYLRLADESVAGPLKAEAGVFGGDAWELFLSAERKAPLMQLGVGPGGRFAGLTHGGPSGGWDPGARVVSEVRAGGWIAYIVFSLGRLLPDRRVERGQAVYGNFFRSAVGRSFAWSPTPKGRYDDAGRFGELVFE